MRCLLVTRRHVPLDRSDDYLLMWEALRHTVEEAGGRAWIFRGAAHEDQFLEFVEWKDGAGEPLQDERVRQALEQLDSFGPAGNRDEWEEAT